MTGASVDLAMLREQVRERLTMVRVATFDGLQLRISEGQLKGEGLCPFHTEKSGSFVAGGRKFVDRYKCFGCGAEGDIFQYWQERRSVDHAEAVRQLAGLAGVYYGEISYEKPKAGVAPAKRLVSVDAEAEKPSLPSLYQAKEADCKMIAETRGLSFEGVWIAASVWKRVAVVRQWPLYQSKHDGQWRPKDGWEQHRCWAAVDETRNVAEFRRVDNGLHMRVNAGPEDKGPKVWSTAGKNWPLGAGQIGARKRVLLVEGGPDMLSAFHFLRLWHSKRHPLLQDVAVVAMLGASNRMREDAMVHFKGCRVRIMVDADTPKDDEIKSKRKLVGLEAAHRWQGQLTEAGAAVELFYVGDIFNPEHVGEWHEGKRLAGEIEVMVEGYKMKDGGKVKDLNDLAKCGEDVIESQDVEQAMRAWDF
jgi:hypothetical protein